MFIYNNIHGSVNGSLGGDGGAVGILNEQDCVLDIANRVIAKLQSLGHKTIAVRPSSASSVIDSLSQRVTKANNAGVDYFVSIHLNAADGNAYGSEVWYESQNGYNLGKPVLDNLIALGFTNRGMKNCDEQGEHLYVVMNPSAPAILIECCFCDSSKDANLYDPEKIANAIVKGLTGQTSDVTSNTTSDTKVATIDYKQVQHYLNVLKIRDNSGNALDEDGVAGTKTVGAISNFQALMGLSTSGKYDSVTKAALTEIISRPLCKINCSYKYATKYLQTQLMISPKDGVFGKGTNSGIKTWQTNHKLDADGIFGQKSWACLLD